jgi:transcription termination/antitermination protein NusA
VMIRGAVREAGDRAKVAVYSRERDVDPVGACVGMKGTRVQSIIRELRGEKIDIVEWSEDPILFVTNAISPAKVQRVSIVNDAEKVMEVIVEDKQLSLAIGKKGQNVRLAAKLTGWKIDIKSEEEKRKEVEEQLGKLGEPEPEPEPETDSAEAEVEAQTDTTGGVEAAASAESGDSLADEAEGAEQQGSNELAAEDETAAAEEAKAEER